MVIQGETQELQLQGVSGEFRNTIQEVEQYMFTPSSKSTEVGGSSILYPLAQGMDLTYQVRQTKVKQELIINELSVDLKLYLQDTTEAPDSMATNNSKFGMMESMILPENTELWAGNHQITAAGRRVWYKSTLNHERRNHRCRHLHT